MMTCNDLFTLLPVLVLVVWAVVLLVVDLWIPKARKGIDGAAGCRRAWRPRWA